MTTCPSCGAPAADGARFCASCGASLAAPTSEERKVATIVFADVVGSTEIGEQLDPERLRSVLSEYFGEMSRVITTWGGTVEKFIGDAVVAFFGVPVAREDDAIRGLHAAWEMLAALEGLNSGFQARHGVRLGIRVGVNTGEVLVPTGVAPGGQFLVSGDAVNVAARLEQSAEPETVLVGDRTWEAARDAFDFGQPVELAVKGKSMPLTARRLGPPTGSEQRGVRFQAPMVGRDRDLQTLLGLLDEAIETSGPRLAVISGPAGIGKSRLLREFVAAASERHPSVTVLRGRCLAAGHGITFWALGEILRAACRISLDEPAESAAAKLLQTLDGLLDPLGLSQTERDETVFALATSANLALANNPLAELEPERVGEAIARAWSRFLAALSVRSPLTIIVEDLHWADERMVALLELLGGRSSGRLLLLATCRPEFLESHRDFASNEDLTVLSLRPLTDAQSERLIGELLGGSDALQSLLTDIRQKADGNPFFLEEILQRLIDEGAIVREAGRWRATERAASVRLPDTIHAVLAARIDALPAAEKSAIQQAAVVGRIFWPGSLGHPASDSTEVLRSLERRGLVTARPTSTIEGEAEYIFRHVLIRDVAYTSVPKSRRARAHAETAAWIENLVGDRLDEFGELLAYHYLAAVAGEDADLAWAGAADERERLRRRALEIALRAGAGARHRFAVEKAIALHAQALELCADDRERAQTLEELADDHEALFQMDEAVATYFDAVAAARRGDGETASIGRLAAKVALATQRWGAFKQTPPVAAIRALLDEALALDLDDRARATLLIGLGGIASSAPRGSRGSPLSEPDRRNLSASIAAAEQGLELATRLDDASLLYRANDALTDLYKHAGQYEKLWATTEREVDLIDRLPYARQQVDVLASISLARADQGRYRDALEAAERGYSLGSAVSAHERMHASFALMSAALALGEWDRLLEVWPWHLEAAANEPAITCPAVRGGPPLGAIVLAYRGDVEKAVQLVPVAAKGSERRTLTDRSIEAELGALAGRRDVAAAIVEELLENPERFRYDDGLTAFLEAARLLGRDDDVRRAVVAARELSVADAALAPSADRAEGDLALRAGRPDEARPLLESALSGFEKLSMPFEAAQTRQMLATVSDGAEALELLESAIASYDQLGARPYAEDARAALARLIGNVSLSGG